MPDTDLDIKQLRAFISVATEQSFTGAAKALNCTQGTISSRIRALENQLGVRLFDRARFNIRMTPAGSDLFGGAQALLERHDQLFGHAHSKNVSGTVSLGIAEGFGSPLLTRLLRRHPAQLHRAQHHRLLRHELGICSGWSTKAAWILLWSH